MPNCEECRGKCCCGIIDVYSQDEIFYDDSLVCVREDREYDRQMHTDKNNWCIALKDGKCSIYEKRPMVCREFQVGSRCCINFFTGQRNAHTCFPCPISEQVQHRKDCGRSLAV
jgi:Fe-S-cluster containining protein